MATHGMLLENRRAEARQQYSDVQLTWRKGLSGRWKQSWLHDLSESGLSIVVSNRSHVLPGQDIELIRRGCPRRILCKVIRAENWKDDNVLVGARIMDGDESLSWIYPGPNGLKQKRPLARRKKMMPRFNVRSG